MLRTAMIIGCGILGITLFANPVLAKGLDELEAAAEDGAEEATDATGQAAEEAAEQEDVEKVETAAKKEAVVKERKVTESMYLSTAFGWASGSRSEGNWKASGFSDVTFGYRIPVTVPKTTVYGTYRYAPLAISGDIDGNAYRGVWDTHYFGGLGVYDMGSFDLVGTFELGYVLVYLDSVDGIEMDASHEENGVSVAIGGGADWELLGQPGFKFGPRLTAGFGGFTTFQFGAGATFMF